MIKARFEWSRGDASDIDGRPERAKAAGADESISLGRPIQSLTGSRDRARIPRRDFAFGRREDRAFLFDVRTAFL